MAKKDKRPDFRPKKATRRNKVRVWIERGILGVMMSVVAWVVERRLLKVIKSGTSSKRALEKDEKEEDQRRRGPSRVRREAGVAAGAGKPNDD
jgi:hypothetical protein